MKKANTDQRHVLIVHNILWSRYKAAVFSELSLLSDSTLRYSFVQIAETELDRQVLSPVDTTRHKYPYQLLNAGPYDQVPTLRIVLQLVRLVMRTRADLIVIPSYSKVEYWATLFAAKACGSKVAVCSDSTREDHPQRRVKNVAKRAFFRMCDGYFCYGQRAAEYIAFLGGSPSKTFIRCQAAALPENYGIEAVRAARNAQVDSDEPRFLYVGRLSPEKGLEALLTAVAGYRERHGNGTLVLCGDGPSRKRLEALSFALGLSEATEFNGGVDAQRLATEYARASCLVLPSLSEPWGLVVNESLHYGCPVLVSDRCGCVPELVLDDTTGYQFDPSDPAALLSGLERLSTATLSHRIPFLEGCLQTIEPFNPPQSAGQVHAGCQILLQIAPKSNAPTVPAEYIKEIETSFRPEQN